MKQDTETCITADVKYTIEERSVERRKQIFEDWGKVTKEDEKEVSEGLGIKC